MRHYAEGGCLVNDRSLIGITVKRSQVKLDQSRELRSPSYATLCENPTMHRLRVCVIATSGDAAVAMTVVPLR